MSIFAVLFIIIVSDYICYYVRSRLMYTIKIASNQ